MKCPDCGKRLVFERANGLTTYKFLCEDCKNEYEIDMEGNIRRLTNCNDLFNTFFGGKK